jgi:hypothetical protein
VFSLLAIMAFNACHIIKEDEEKRLKEAFSVKKQKTLMNQSVTLPLSHSIPRKQTPSSKGKTVLKAKSPIPTSFSDIKDTESLATVSAQPNDKKSVSEEAPEGQENNFPVTKPKPLFMSTIEEVAQTDTNSFSVSHFSVMTDTQSSCALPRANALSPEKHNPTVNQTTKGMPFNDLKSSVSISHYKVEEDVQTETYSFSASSFSMTSDIPEDRDDVKSGTLPVMGSKNPPYSIQTLRSETAKEPGVFVPPPRTALRANWSKDTSRKGAQSSQSEHSMGLTDSAFKKCKKRHLGEKPSTAVQPQRTPIAKRGRTPPSPIDTALASQPVPKKPNLAAIVTSSTFVPLSPEIPLSARYDLKKGHHLNEKVRRYLSKQQTIER